MLNPLCWSRYYKIPCNRGCRRIKRKNKIITYILLPVYFSFTRMHNKNLVAVVRVQSLIVTIDRLYNFNPTKLYVY